METDYKPDGWLGILVGTKLFYDFSGKYDFSDKSNQLLREISGLKKRTSMSEVPTKVPPVRCQTICKRINNTVYTSKKNQLERLAPN